MTLPFSLRASGLALGLLLLASCKVGPDYQKPHMALPARWQSAPGAGKDALQLQADWWQRLNDPALNALMAKALAGNEDLKIDLARIREARAVRSSADNDLLPVVNTTGTATREANRIAFGGVPFNLATPFNNFQAGFDASWELDLFGAKRREIEADNDALAARIAGAGDTRISLLAEVARNYAELRLGQRQLAVATAIVQDDAHTLAIARDRFRSGSAPRLDVTQAEAHLASDRAALPGARVAAASAGLALDVLMGEMPGAAIAIAGNDGPLPEASGDVPLAAPADILAHRPDVQVAEDNLAAATARHGVSVAHFFPDISLAGFAGLLSTQSDRLLNAASKSWSVGGNLVWPILNYGKLNADLEAAKAREDEALAIYRKSVLTAMSDVERALTRFREESFHRDALARSLAESNHAVAIARERYQAGLTNYLEVLDAERIAQHAESDKTVSDAQLMEDRISLYKSLGGAWEFSPPAEGNKKATAPK